MILIADGGSTKCDWMLLDNSATMVWKTRTKGLNPSIVFPEELHKRITSNAELQTVLDTVTKVDFYGAGCGTTSPRKLLQEVIASCFPNAKVNVQEDTVAAVHAATTAPGIVCILGTGSNSCYFDGKRIHTEIDSLGYVLMDEASGNYFGKRLLRDYFYKKMPEKLRQDFASRFNLNSDVIKQNLYKEPNPNAYLASFAAFIFTSQEVNGYFYKLISEGIQRFIEDRVLCFKEAQHVPIHFIGSIAHFSEEIIRDCMKPYHLQLGKIIRRPIDGLLQYYQNQLIQS